MPTTLLLSAFAQGYPTQLRRSTLRNNQCTRCLRQDPRWLRSCFKSLPQLHTRTIHRIVTDLHDDLIVLARRIQLTRYATPDVRSHRDCTSPRLIGGRRNVSRGLICVHTQMHYPTRVSEVGRILGTGLWRDDLQPSGVN